MDFLAFIDVNNDDTFLFNNIATPRYYEAVDAGNNQVKVVNVCSGRVLQTPIDFNKYQVALATPTDVADCISKINVITFSGSAA